MLCPPPFLQIFLLNLRAEFPQLNAPPQEEEEGCSDVLAVMACERELQRASKVDKHAQIVLAHNEDVGRDSIGGLYFVRVTQVMIGVSSNCRKAPKVRQMECDMPLHTLAYA